MSSEKVYELIIFDLDGTLTNTPFIDKKPRTLLPGRLEKCQELVAQGVRLAIATNQGGVAFGFTTEQKATEEVQVIATAIGAVDFQVAFGHPTPKRGYESYSEEYLLALRKPRPGMLINLMEGCGVSPSETLMVGDRDEDRLAAEAAGVTFEDATRFFATGEYSHLLEIVIDGAVPDAVMKSFPDVALCASSDYYKVYVVFLREDLSAVTWEMLNGLVLYGQIVTYKCRPLKEKGAE